MKAVSFREYIVEGLKNAIYEKGESSDVIIAEAPDLPGCFTQGKNFEEARQNLIGAIKPKRALPTTQAFLIRWGFRIFMEKTTETTDFTD